MAVAGLLFGGVAAAGAGSATAATGWSLATSANPSSTGDSLFGVACGAPDLCVAVGYQLAAGNATTLAETFDGTTWTASVTPNPGTNDQLQGISCSGAHSCVAVGTYTDGSGDARTLVETFDGTSWTVRTSQNAVLGSSDSDDLTAVSCPTASFCAATGNSYAGTNNTLVETSTDGGTTWSLATDATVAGANLRGVSCASSTFCEAVGNGYTNQTVTLVETLNGSTWSVTPSPNLAGATSNSLHGVSCTRSNSCQAVGQSLLSLGGDNQTLVERFNGRNWKILPSPNSSGAGDVDYLTGVSCPTADSCEAAGSYISGTTGHFQTLVESYSGGSWTLVPSPNTGAPDSNLGGDYVEGNTGGGETLACGDEAPCLAVGNSATFGDPSASRTMILMGPVFPGPSITKITPASGPVGTRVTIKGKYLAGATEVSFHGTDAKIIHDAASKVIVKVPRGATSGTVEITTPDGTAISPAAFTVTP